MIHEGPEMCLIFIPFQRHGMTRDIDSQKPPHAVVTELITTDIWQMMETVFIRPKNINLDRHLLFSSKQNKSERVKHYQSTLKKIYAKL